MFYINVEKNGTYIELIYVPFFYTNRKKRVIDGLKLELLVKRNRQFTI